MKKERKIIMQREQGEIITILLNQYGLLAKDGIIFSPSIEDEFKNIRFAWKCNPVFVINYFETFNFKQI